MKRLNLLKKLLLLIVALSTFSLTMAQEEDFNATVEEDDKKTATGGFGADLSKNASFVNFNGYITNEFFSQQGKRTTFDNHYFNIFISSQLTERIFIEGQLEYEHGGEEVELRYGYADYKVSEAFVVRSGKFLVPAGEFNEYLYPEYLNKTVSRAYVNREISPSAWGEIGVQVRGRIATDGNATPFYAVYVVNGLNGASGDGIRSLRNNFRDTDGGSNDNKAVGGAFGVDLGDDITISTNYYSGKYTEDNELNLSILGASFYMNKENFSIWGEYHMATQEAYNDPTDVSLGVTDLNKNGFYIQGGFMVTDKFEPIVRYDEITLDGAPEGDRSRITFGANYYLAKNAVVKINYELRSDDGADADDNLFGAQISIGF